MSSPEPRVGEVVTVFRNRLEPDTVAAYGEEPRHREAQRRGISDYYASYSIAVGQTSYASSSVRGHPTDPGARRI